MYTEETHRIASCTKALLQAVNYEATEDAMSLPGLPGVSSLKKIQQNKRTCLSPGADDQLCALLAQPVRYAQPNARCGSSDERHLSIKALALCHS